MKKRLSCTKAQLLAVAMILFGIYTYSRPSAVMQPSGYADLCENEVLAERIARLDIHDFEEPSDIVNETLEEKLTLVNVSETKPVEDAIPQKQPRQAVQNTHQVAKVSDEKETGKEVTQTIVKEEVIVIPEAGEEKVVSVNSQYIGNSGKVFETYEEAQAYGQQQMIDYPDTTAGYHVLNSWKYPVNGTTLYTVDLEFVS